MSAGDSGGGGGKPKPSSSGLQLSTGFTSSAPSIGTTVTMGETTAGYGNGQGYGTLQDNYISHEEQALVMGLTRHSIVMFGFKVVWTRCLCTGTFNANDCSYWCFK